ncbi:MAG TPA: TonB family protein, partial [Longimicrobium sp.]|nr:TonB family protein [Longimicrobium sp.]
MVGLERLLIGRTLDGRYTIEELIGHGRGGLVYRARHPHTGVEVALKVLAAPRTAEARERFRTVVGGEVRRAAAIEHANVASVYCLGHDAELDLDFVTTELLRGQTLASVLSQRGKPPIALGLRLLSDAAEGLAAGHAAGLVHRDLRPASLYLVRREAERQVRVKVTGFGVPQFVRRDSLADAAPEVSGYASPEMLANGSLRLTPAGDVFSLGVVGYELLTGRLPFDEAARRELAQGRTVEAEPPADVAQSVPPQVVEAVLQALRCNPAERPADGAAFFAALQQPVRQVVAVGKIAPAAQTAPEAQPAEPVPAAAPVPAAQAETPSAPEVATPIAAADEVVDVADLVVDEPEPIVPEITTAEAAPAPAESTVEPIAPTPVAEASEPEPAAVEAPALVAPIEAAAAVDAAADVARVVGPTIVETVPVLAAVDVAPAAVELAVVGSAPVFDAPASAVPAAVEPTTVEAAAPPVAQAVIAPPSPPRDLTRAPAPKQAGRGAATVDLELYYPPQAPKPPVAVPVAATFSPPQPAAAPIEPAPPAPVVIPPAPVAATPPPAPIPVSPAPVSETPAPAPAPVPQQAPVKLKITPGSARKRPATGSGTYRGPAMAAGFVLGILVLGSVAWVATHAGGETPAADAPVVASQLVPGSPATPSATPAADAADQPQSRTPITAPTADTATRTAQQRAADARKKQQDDERRRLEEERTRQAQLLQQQQLAAQQAAARPAPVQPQAQPQQVAVAPQPRLAAQPAAPPPPPPPAPAREEPAASAPPANQVFDEDVVEERPRLTNVSELQRSLQDRYPAQLYANRVSGNVTATFVVGADGRVDPSSINIVSSPHPGFNGPTQGVLRRARFRPARVKGQPVRVQVTMPIAWTIA